MPGNILIVDDSPLDRKIIRTVISGRLSDINIYEVDNGDDTLLALKEENISVCILDIMMSGKDGFQILTEIKKDSRLCDIPTIVCTGLHDAAAIETALTLGAYDYFTKPLSEEAMKISLPLKVKNAIEFKQKNDRILYLSNHDKMTGLLNRRFYEEEMERLQKETCLPLSFIIGDVNGLKLTNDAFGHEEGDRLLIRISKILKDAVQTDASIFRTGGDEFVIVMPFTPRAEAENVIAQITSMCSKEEENPVRPSISLGIATKETPDQELSYIYKQAENQMYSNKLLESKNVKDSILLSLRNALNSRDHKQ